MSSPRRKASHENGILGKMGENAQLDLRIIGGKKQLAGRGDEGGANFAAESRCGWECSADSGLAELRRPVAVPV